MNENDISGPSGDGVSNTDHPRTVPGPEAPTLIPIGDTTAIEPPPPTPIGDKALDHADMISSEFGPSKPLTVHIAEALYTLTARDPNHLFCQEEINDLLDRLLVLCEYEPRFADDWLERREDEGDDVSGAESDPAVCPDGWEENASDCPSRARKGKGHLFTPEAKGGAGACAHCHRPRFVEAQ